MNIHANSVTKVLIFAIANLPTFFRSVLRLSMSRVCCERVRMERSISSKVRPFVSGRMKFNVTKAIKPYQPLADTEVTSLREPRENRRSSRAKSIY